MASSDVGLEDCDFVFEVVGAGGEGFVVFADRLGILGGGEEFIGFGLLNI